MDATAAETRKSWFPAIFAAVLALLTFAVCLRGTYIYDDILILRIDERLKSISQIYRFWTESYHNGVDNLYRPLVSSTYAIEYWLHGDRPWIFHGVNVLLHALVSAMVARLAQKLINNKAGWIAGAIYAVHPIHVEAVANIVGRAELMCAAGAVGAMLFMLRSPFRGRDGIGVIVCTLISLLSKEQGMLLPVMLGILWWCKRRMNALAPSPTYAGDNSGIAPSPAYSWERVGVRVPSEPASRLREEKEPSPRPSPGVPGEGENAVCVIDNISSLKSTFAVLCIILGAYVVLRENVLHLKFWWDRIFLDWTINPLVREDADRTLMPLVLLGRYAALLIAPYKLSADYGAKVIGWQVDWQQPWVYLGMTSVLMWLVLFAISIRRKNGALCFALLGLGITYGIVGNVVSLIGVNFAERLMYLPSVFFVLIVAMGIAKLRGGTIFCSILIALSMLRTVTYAAKWNDALSFYEYSIAQQPAAIRLQMLLVSEHLLRGDAAEKRGGLETAKQEYALAQHAVDRTRNILPEYDELWVQSASVAISQKDYDSADAYLDEAMRVASKDKRRSMLKAANWKNRVAELRAATQPSSNVR